jgi:hypothetical protein
MGIIILGVCPLEGLRKFISKNVVTYKEYTIHIYKIYNIGRAAENFDFSA